MPIMVIPGAMDSAFGFISRGLWGKPWTLQLVDQGFDLWLHNPRGVKHSNRHERDGEWTQKERWDFTWAEMGYFDVPASIDKIL